MARFADVATHPKIRLADGEPDEAKAITHAARQEGTAILRLRHTSLFRFPLAKGLLGERGLVELVSLCGYYTLVSFTLNAFAVPLPDGVAPKWG